MAFALVPFSLNLARAGLRHEGGRQDKRHRENAPEFHGELSFHPNLLLT
jgi:hypothetical protein